MQELGILQQMLENWVRLDSKDTDKPSKPEASKRISNEALLAQDVEGTARTWHPCRQWLQAALLIDTIARRFAQ